MQARRSRPEGHVGPTSLRTLLVLVLGLAVGSVGHAFLSAGMRRVSASAGAGIAAFVLATISEPRVLIGVVLQGFFFATYLFALSRADLSFVLPITALDYLLTAVVASVALGERPPPMRWIGTGLIAAGIVLIARSAEAMAHRGM
jgi:drug/metabolite transporter (DMT)-like permease